MTASDEYFHQLRGRWFHQRLQHAALMTYLEKATDDADADRQLRGEGETTVNHMISAGLLPVGTKVYEIGCGPGRVATALAEFWEYSGVDISPQYIDICRQRCPRGTFAVTNGHEFPFPDQSADLVIEFSVFCHMPLEQVWRWLLETRRVLRPGGRTYLQFHNLKSEHQWVEFLRQNESWAFVKDLGYPRSLTRETVELLVQRAGLYLYDMIASDHDAWGPRSWFVVAGPDVPKLETEAVVLPVEHEVWWRRWFVKTFYGEPAQAAR